MTFFYEGVIFHEFFSSTLTFAPASRDLASRHFSNPLHHHLCLL